MSKTTTPFDYKTLAAFLLPQGILDFFDVTNVFQENTGEIEITGSENILIHLNSATLFYKHILKY